MSLPTADLLQPAQATALVYQGTVITQRQEMLSLTDMWKAAGSDPQQAPAKWRALPATKAFVDHVELTIGKSDSLFSVKEGRGGTTYAHWQIGLAYAKYLSPEFHMWCNTVVRERMEGRVIPAHVAVSSLDAEALKVLGGIFKGIANKAIENHLAPIMSAVTVLTERVDAVASGYDPTAGFTTDYAPMCSFINPLVPNARKRNVLVRSASRRCTRWLIGRGLGAKLKISRESNRHLFHVDAAAEWMEAEGKILVREHNDRIAGQTVMKFPRKPDGRGATPPTGGGLL